MKRTTGWLIGLALLVVGLLGGVVGVRAVQERAKKPTGTATTTNISEVVRSIERQEKVVLLSLGIQGITERSQTRKVWGVDVPGSQRTTFMQYNYRALLGVDGKFVKVVPSGENAVRITLPEFMFIGYDSVSFKTAVEKNGALSWITPEVDQPTLISEILNDKAKDEHVQANRDTLESQARAFYGGIVKGVDPSVTVTYNLSGTR